MVDIPSSILPLSRVRGRTASTISSSGGGGGSDDDIITVSDGVTESDSPVQLRINKMAGHPCAAGCGHICWAANGPIETFP